MKILILVFFLSLTAKAQNLRLHLDQRTDFGGQKDQAVMLIRDSKQVYFYGEYLQATADGRVLLFGNQFPGFFVEVGRWKGSIETEGLSLDLEFELNKNFQLTRNPSVVLGIHDTLFYKGTGSPELVREIPELVFPVKPPPPPPPTDQLYRDLIEGLKVELQVRYRGFKNEIPINTQYASKNPLYTITTTDGTVIGSFYSEKTGENAAIFRPGVISRGLMLQGELFRSVVELRIMTSPGSYENVRFEVAVENSMLDQAVSGGLGRVMFSEMSLSGRVSNGELVGLDLTPRTRLLTEHGYPSSFTVSLSLKEGKCVGAF